MANRATVPQESTHDGTCPCDRCCPDCDGAGWITANPKATWPRDPRLDRDVRCDTCHGDGTVDEQTIAARDDDWPPF